MIGFTLLVLGGSNPEILNEHTRILNETPEFSLSIQASERSQGLRLID